MLLKRKELAILSFRQVDRSELDFVEDELRMKATVVGAI